MDIKIEAFSDSKSSYMKTALNIRYEIFTEELNINKREEFDGLDKRSTHYLIFYDKVAAGVCRWRKMDDYIYIDRLGIKSEFRGRGLAVLLLKYVVDELIPSKKDIFIITPDSNFSFLRGNGFFKIIDVFKISGVEYFKLKFKRNRAKYV